MTPWRTAQSLHSRIPAFSDCEGGEWCAAFVWRGIESARTRVYRPGKSMTSLVSACLPQPFSVVCTVREVLSSVYSIVVQESMPFQGPERTYLFIDGAYAQDIYRRAMESVFGVAGEISVQAILSQVQPFRTYYYDCLDETKRDAETDVEFRTRLDSQERYFEELRSLRGVHLQLGTLTGAKRRRQKEVDVLLAVDMMTHGFNQNMTRAVLLSGDLDFRPVVDALVRRGVFVEIWYEKTTTAKELYWAADLGQPLDWHTIRNWSDSSFLSTHALPRETSAHSSIAGVLVRSGTFQGRAAEIIKPSPGPFILKVHRVEGIVWMEHEDQRVLDGYFSVMNGPIDWR